MKGRCTIVITRMEITYRSKNPCDITPKLFSTGSYEIVLDGATLRFDFEDSEFEFSFENGYLYVNCLQKNLDIIDSGGMEEAEIDNMMRTARMDDYMEIYYECFENEEECEEGYIELIPQSITFYDCSDLGDGEPIIVEGEYKQLY